jgi:hypothetical protein
MHQELNVQLKKESIRVVLLVSMERLFHDMWITMMPSGIALEGQFLKCPPDAL